MPRSSKCVAKECLLCRARHNRHAYATHLLEVGLPVQQLQHLLGHQNLQSTLRYVHWVPDYREAQGARDLVARLRLPS